MATFIVQVRAIRHLTADLTIKAASMGEARQQVAQRFGSSGIKWEESSPEDEQIESVSEAVEEREPTTRSVERADMSNVISFIEGFDGDELQEGIPELIAAAKKADEVLKFIAGIPKHGEPDLCDPGSNQDWSVDFGNYAIEQLHDVIDMARTIVTKAEDK